MLWSVMQSQLPQVCVYMHEQYKVLSAGLPASKAVNSRLAGWLELQTAAVRLLDTVLQLWPGQGRQAAQRTPLRTPGKQPRLQPSQVLQLPDLAS